MQLFKRLLPLLIFILAFGYRLIGITWGLPSELHHQSYHPDEEVIWSYSQQIEPSKLHFTPGFYNYGTLYLTVLRVASDMAGAYGGHNEVDPAQPPSSPTLSDWKWIRNCHLAGRVISALFGALIAVFVFLILRSRMNLVGASFGALMPALAPGLLVHSRFQTVDVMATALLVISSYFALRLIDYKDREPAEGAKPDSTALKLAIWSGVFAGLSAGTKYTGFLAIFTLLAALWLSKRPDRVKLGGIGFGAMIGAFLLATPGALLENAAFMRDVKYEMLHTATGHGLIFEGMGSGFLVHIGNLLQVVGLLGLLLGFVGCFYAVWPKKPNVPESDETPVPPSPTAAIWMWALIAFALPYYILIGRAEVLFLRYTFPLILVVAAGFGYLVAWAHEKGGGWRTVPVLAILALGQAATVGARMTMWMTGPEPRDAAALHIKQESQPQTTVGLASDPWYYTPPLFPDSAMSRMGVVDRGNPKPTMVYLLSVMSTTQAPHVEQYLPANARDRYDWDVRLLTESKPDYITFSSFEANDLFRLSPRKDLGEIDKLLVDRFMQFKAELEKSYALERAIGDPSAAALAHDMQYIQPTIWIWKRKT